MSRPMWCPTMRVPLQNSTSPGRTSSRGGASAMASGVMRWMRVLTLGRGMFGRTREEKLSPGAMARPRTRTAPTDTISSLRAERPVSSVSRTV